MDVAALEVDYGKPQRCLSSASPPVLSDEFEPVSVCRGNRELIRNKVDATR